MIQVNSCNLRFLVDTGADDNYISDKYTDISTNEVKETEKIVELANREKTVITQKLALKFNINGYAQTFEEDFFILPSLPYDGFFRIQFLKKT